MRIIIISIAVFILSLSVFADENTNQENMSLPYQVRIDFFQKGNLFKNSSFEEWNGNHPVFWEAKEINKGEGITGNAVLFDKKDNSWSELVSEFIPVIPGNYFLKAKVKMENVIPPEGQKVGDILKVQLVHYDENKKVIERKDGYRYKPFDWSDKNMPFKFFDSIKEFKWSEVRFATDFYPLETGDIPDNTKYVQFIFKYKGPGKIWIDDISYSYTKWNFTPLERMEKYFDKDLSTLGEIIPTPKIVNYSDEYLTTDSKVQFIIPKENNKEIKNGISQLQLNKRENDDFESIIHTKNEIDSDIIVSVGDNELNRELLTNKKIEIDRIKNQQDGYIIKFLNYDNKSVVVIYGLNSVGNYYGLVSFNQLIRIESIDQEKNEISIRKADVTDWPDFKLRMISGYTAQADDAQKIKAAFEWMSSFKLNWFVLNYPSTSLQWWNPPLYYENMQKILKTEKEKFGEVIHFGNIINPYYNNSSFTQFLNETETAFRISDKEKVEDLNKIIDIGLGNGGELVMVAVDDFVPHIAHQWGKKIFDQKDLQKFGSAGKAHAYLANYSYNHAKQKNSDVIFLFCPMNYNNYFVEIADLNSGINYFKDLGENVDENIGIIWTGSTVRSLDNDYAQIKRFSTYLQGRYPMLWDNTPYARARAAGYSWGHSPYKATLCNLFEAYEVNFPPDFHKYTFRSGVYINAGTGERYRAKDITIADFLWNQNTYDPDLSLWKALLTLYGKSDAIAILMFNDAYWQAQQVLNKYLKLKYQSERKILKEYNWTNPADATESEKEKYNKESQDLFKQSFTINMKNQILTEYPEKRERMLNEFYQIKANSKLLNELKDYIFNQEKIFLEIKEYKVN